MTQYYSFVVCELVCFDSVSTGETYKIELVRNHTACSEYNWQVGDPPYLAIKV